ncbi:YigZ family protein [Deferribacter thermophilus]|uniref:IMPACT family protein n=1 Tax=Deferribacter thermophilus TaxID=53573 RepID=UPI003C1F612C
MFTVLECFTESYEVKKSKFISYLLPTSMFDVYLKKLRKEHSKANHIVWAYRLLNDNGLIEERETDDGEPKNSSGKPTLKVIQGNNLINVVIFTVRYFGGVKLGFGGLIKAYTEAALKVIQKAELIDFVLKEKMELSISINRYSHFLYLINKYNLSLIRSEFINEKVKVVIEGEKENLSLFLDIVKGF